MARKLIGTAMTDENGEATITYTGTGAGKLNIVAESGTFLSEIYEVTDAKAVFNGTSYISSAGVITPNSDGSYTLGTNGTNYMIFGFSSSSSQSDRYFASIGGAFEFDVIEYTGEITLRSNISGGSNRDVNTIWEANTHYKIEIIENGVKINGVTKSFDDTGARNLILRIENNASITIKNLLYY